MFCVTCYSLYTTVDFMIINDTQSTKFLVVIDLYIVFISTCGSFSTLEVPNTNCYNRDNYNYRNNNHSYRPMTSLISHHVLQLLLSRPQPPASRMAARHRMPPQGSIHSWRRRRRYRLWNMPSHQGLNWMRWAHLEKGDSSRRSSSHSRPWKRTRWIVDPRASARRSIALGASSCKRGAEASSSRKNKWQGRNRDKHRCFRLR